MMPRARTSPLIACFVTLGFWACSNDSQTGNDTGAGTGGSETGGTSSGGTASGGNDTGGRTSELVCEPGETQACFGPGACDGGQQCANDGREWLPCDCGSAGAGGNAGAGGTDTGGASNGGSGSGSASTGGSGTGSTGTGGGVSLPGTLTVQDGWVSAESNTVGIQGAVFAFHDDAGTTVTDGITGDEVCISGTAVMVDPGCDPGPWGDCYGYAFGAAIGLNLNQPTDSETGEPMETPLPYDGTGLQGFSFFVTGTAIPTALRFEVHDADGTEYCQLPSTPIAPGSNTFVYESLVTQCWDTSAGASHTSTNGSDLIKVSWAVITNEASSVPYDFCISNIRAIPD